MLPPNAFRISPTVLTPSNNFVRLPRISTDAENGVDYISSRVTPSGFKIHHVRASRLPPVAMSGNLYLRQHQLLNDLLSRNPQVRMVSVIQDEVRPTFESRPLPSVPGRQRSLPTESDQIEQRIEQNKSAMTGMLLIACCDFSPEMKTGEAIRGYTEGSKRGRK